MTLAEYKAFRKGALLRSIDEMEQMHIHAFKSAQAQGFDKNGKPIYKSFKDMFDRSKVERELLGDSDSRFKRVDKEIVDQFKQSKEHAELVLNGISASTGEEND